MTNLGHFITLCATILSAHAIYEDQVGKFDWKRSFIGKVKHAQFDTKRLIVTTHENIIASLSPKTGEIQWRQLMEDPQEHQPQLLHLDKDAVTVSGGKSRFYVRGWDAPTGSLLWEWPLVLDRPGDSFWLLQGDLLVHVLAIKGSHMEVTQFSVKTGEVRAKTRKIPETWVSGDKCVTANPYFVCVFNGQLFWLDVVNEGGRASSQPIQGGPDCNLLEFDGPKPAVLLVRQNSAKIVELGGAVLPHEVAPNAVSIGSSVFQLEANLDNLDKLVRVKSFDLVSGRESSVEIDYPLGLGGPYIVSGQCRGPACELLLSSTDHALTLVRLPEGRVSWTREEALSNIISVEFFELPVSDLEASIETEFTDNDVITMFTRRISTQTKQLVNLVSGQFGSTRDDFGLHRIIVVATAVGKLFGIDTLRNGSIVWTYRLPNVKPVMLLVQRTARHAPLPAQCVLLAQDVTTGGGVLFAFDPISGESRGLDRLSYRIKQAFVAPNEDEEHLKPVIVIGADDSVRVFPERGPKTVAYVYTIDQSLVQGYRLEPDGLKPVWNLNLGVCDLVGVSTRPVTERVHSQGRVLHDRSVHYKYVNPNLIALATLSEDPVHKSVLNVFLVDGVTGFVVYSTSHKKAKGPVHLVHSENWLVYTFFNERFRRTEIVATELYEGSIQSNSTVFSSFAISQLPEVKTESYILPANPVSMSVTLTERGITNKFLLVGTSSGSVVEIPWMLLQPRFADMPCGPEESCFPYMPEIAIPPEATINYNQTLARIRKIAVAPAKLESTSHVLVHGLDLFYTRVAPSKTFDLLKEDFDHRLIVLVLVGLVVASYVTKYLAAKKALRQAWK
ncbi:ER membrane protein complex subunit 1 [Tribolium castaneum]|uniref:ER membrane protein complex subunit 1 n=1 Tax=Tribolium castaneum TaxID=7070 RepID=D6WIT7_TRICA|nr:PREDICTED: ER membrane protein complex subunit 1 [Tribolium castaneum]EEZ99650.1 ER membrane protein complex subunit 1-like Protein [Tribolium castaneum]|eukprot:XP_967657.1 PREDICTED: ER membrane protein complex subunit 1 [Tribolium castaneum]